MSDDDDRIGQMWSSTWATFIVIDVEEHRDPYKWTVLQCRDSSITHITKRCNLNDLENEPRWTRLC